MRHQWVREHGTPRLTVLAGPASAAQELWHDWLALTGRDPKGATIFAAKPSASARLPRSLVEQAVAAAIADPRKPIALQGTAAVIDEVVRASSDRVAALLSEGLVRVGGKAPAIARKGVRAAPSEARARSLAELALFEALEATPATAGRFLLNQRVTARFGSADAEVDLLARAESIAIEVDGYHHFADAEHYRRDRRKDLLLQAQGFLVVRVLAEDVHADPRGALRMVCEALAHRSRHARLRRET